MDQPESYMAWQGRATLNFTTLIYPPQQTAFTKPRVFLHDHPNLLPNYRSPWMDAPTSWIYRDFATLPSQDAPSTTPLIIQALFAQPGSEVLSSDLQIGFQVPRIHVGDTSTRTSWVTEVRIQPTPLATWRHPTVRTGYHSVLLGWGHEETLQTFGQVTNWKGV